MRGEQCGDGLRQDLRAAQRQCADVDGALQHALARREIGPDVAQFGQHALEEERDDLARARGHEPARGAVEQRRTQAHLEILQRGADRRLADAELARDQ